MKIQIGNGDEVYGTIATSSSGLTYQGPRIKVLMGMVKERHKRHSQMSDEAFLAWMLEQLQGRTWAKKLSPANEAQGEPLKRATEQWEAEETPDQLKRLQGQGVKYVRWITHPGDKSDAGMNTGKDSAPVCPDCVYNDQLVVPLGEAFPSGNLLPPAHPHCRCTYEPASGPQSAEQAETAAEKTDFSLDY